MFCFFLKNNPNFTLSLSLAPNTVWFETSRCVACNLRSIKSRPGSVSPDSWSSTATLGEPVSPVVRLRVGTGRDTCQRLAGSAVRVRAKRTKGSAWAETLQRSSKQRQHADGLSEYKHVWVFTSAASQPRTHKKTNIAPQEEFSFIYDESLSRWENKRGTHLLADMVPCRWVCNPAHPAAHRQALSPWESLLQRQKRHNPSSNARRATDAASDSGFAQRWRWLGQSHGGVLGPSTSRCTHSRRGRNYSRSSWGAWREALFSIN